ncbi:hypothetical protein ABZ260_04080, partial [Streptosporangium sp. NPDC006013]
MIPRVEAPVVYLRTGDERPIATPQVCPSCGDAIDASQERWRCVRGRACRAIASITYAAGHDQLDIEGLATSRIEQMLDAGLITDFADLFSLTREQVLGRGVLLTAQSFLLSGPTMLNPLTRDDLDAELA